MCFFAFMTSWIDTHAHLFVSEFETDIDDVILRSKNNNICRIVLPNIDFTSIEALHLLCNKYPSMLYPAMGLHPCSVKSEEDIHRLSEIEINIQNHSYVAIGETGIDLYWDSTTLPLQKINFARHIQWAKTYNIPLIIHVRNSFREVFEMLDTHYDPILRGVFHCFSGGEAELEKILSYHHFYVGIGGILTFKKSPLPALIKKIPLEKIVLETDAPYLAPLPHRGKRNESSFLPFIAQKLAGLLDLPLEKIAEHTTENAMKLFFE